MAVLMGGGHQLQNNFADVMEDEEEQPCRNGNDNTYYDYHNTATSTADNRFNNTSAGSNALSEHRFGTA